jgi:transposase
LVRGKVLAFARTLRADDEVVLEATGNTMAIVQLLKPHVGRVVIANPLQVRVIAEAKAKTDRIDAAALARLHAAGYLPEVWQPDEQTELLRNLVSRRATIVQGMTRTKNRIHAVLHTNLIAPFSGKLFMRLGRKWLADQALAEHERSAVNRWLAALDAMEKELTAAEAAVASACLGDDRVRRLMTIGGINMVVAAGILSAIGDVSRFASAEKLVSYLGLDPRVRQGQAGRRRRDRAQDRRAGVASAHEGGGLRVCQAGTGGDEGTSDAAHGRRQVASWREHARKGARLF